MKKKAGQTLIETCIIMMLMCLIFFGLLQLSQLSASKEILDYAASCGVRAQTVGFNEFMVRKVIRVAAIPNAGRIVEPVADPAPAPAPLTGSPGTAWDYALRAQPVSPQYAVERARIPLYLGGENLGRLDGILDYENWDSISLPSIGYSGNAGIAIEIDQDVPLWTPLHQLFFDGDTFPLGGDAILENHYPLYLGNDSN
ncbi:MAG: pilus assembly protein [Kiritimatiellia bacterium]